MRMAWVGAAASQYSKTETTLAGITQDLNNRISRTYVGGTFGPTTDIEVAHDYSHRYTCHGGFIYQWPLLDSNVHRVHGNTSLSRTTSISLDAKLMQISTDGTKIFYRTNASLNNIYVRTLSTPFDVASMSGSVTEFYSFPGTAIAGFRIVNDGRKILIYNSSTTFFDMYDLPTRWSVSSAPVHDYTQNLNASYNNFIGFGMDWSGKSLFIMHNSGGTRNTQSVVRIQLATAFDMSTDGPSPEGDYNLGWQSEITDGIGASIQVSPYSDTLHVMTWPLGAPQIIDLSLDASGSYSTGFCNVATWSNQDYLGSTFSWSNPTNAAIYDYSGTEAGPTTSFSDWLRGLNLYDNDITTPGTATIVGVEPRLYMTNFSNAGSGSVISVAIQGLFDGATSSSGVVYSMIEPWFGMYTFSPSMYGFTSSEIKTTIGSASSGIQILLYAAADFDSEQIGIDTVEMSFRYTLP